MARTITFRPRFPELEVQQLDLEGLAMLTHLLRTELDSFPGVNFYGGQPKLVGRDVVIPTSDPRDYPTHIAGLDDCLVTSENGTRAVVPGYRITGGDLSDVPAELLVPCRGKDIDTFDGPR